MEVSRRLLLLVVLFAGCNSLKVQEICSQVKNGTLGAYSITVDRSNCYYYSDKHESTIYRCCNDTQYELYSGKTKGFVNGDVKDARYNNPTGLVWCGYGAQEGLYIADNECYVRFISKQGEVSTFFGSSDLSCKKGSYDNNTHVKLTYVSSLTCDTENGYLIIMNSGSAQTIKVQVVSPPQPSPSSPPPSPAPQSSPSPPPHSPPKQNFQTRTTAKEDSWVEKSGILFWLPILTFLAGGLLGIYNQRLRDKFFTNNNNDNARRQIQKQQEWSEINSNNNNNNNQKQQNSQQQLQENLIQVDDQNSNQTTTTTTTTNYNLLKNIEGEEEDNKEQTNNFQVKQNLEENQDLWQSELELQSECIDKNFVDQQLQLQNVNQQKNFLMEDEQFQDPLITNMKKLNDSKTNQLKMNKVDQTKKLQSGKMTEEFEELWIEQKSAIQDISQKQLKLRNTNAKSISGD